jgi:hypothetical protein
LTVFDAVGAMAWSFAHLCSPVGGCCSSSGRGVAEIEPVGDEPLGVSDGKLLTRCDEVERAAAAVAIAEAVPGVAVEIDDELVGVAAVMNWTRAVELRAGAFQVL